MEKKRLRSMRLGWSCLWDGGEKREGACYGPRHLKSCSKNMERERKREQVVFGMFFSSFINFDRRGTETLIVALALCHLYGNQRWEVGYYTNPARHHAQTAGGGPRRSAGPSRSTATPRVNDNLDSNLILNQ